jgi:hypothetical protein
MNDLLRGAVSARSSAGLPVLHRSLMVLALAPAIAFGAVLPDEIGGDNFDGFDLTPCDASLTADSSIAKDYAAGLDLCAQTTPESHAPGLISANLSLADGNGTPNASSRRIRPSFGTGILPRRGSALVLLSTGKALASGDVGFVSPQPGFAAGTSSPFPADWLSFHNGQLPAPPSCPPPNGSSAIDPVQLKLRIRVPNNAHSFSLDANFLAADFPEWVCGAYNDYFVALLDSAFENPLNPPDKNLASFNAPSGVPVSVDLAVLDAGLFTQCVNGAIGCLSHSFDSIATCSGTGQLVGTGMDATASSADTCGNANGQVGGGTGWLVIRGNVLPGDVVELRLVIWDTGDGTYDSEVVLDNFRWSYQSVEGGTTLAAP